MAVKQVYYGYDRQAEPATGEFPYCPYCQSRLQQREIGDRQRGACPECGFVQFRNPAPTVSVVIVEEGQVLLGKRGGPPGEGMWSFPAGYVEWDDDFLTAARQEAKEETGLEVELQSVVNVVSSFLTPRYHFLSLYLLARPVGGRLVAGSDLLEVAWVPLTGPWPDIVFEEDRAVLEMLAAGDFQALPVDPAFARPGGAR
ncbi:MAG: NUDIX domain-containing protein [Anaerolineae bacterium]|jgi:ADP-ribose pyrophosphatase YjhB (NUDIX family)